MRSMLSAGAQIANLNFIHSNVAMFQSKSQRFDLSSEKSSWLRLTKSHFNCTGESIR